MPDRDYVLLPLSRGEACKIDPDLAEDLTRHMWSVNPTKSGFYAHRTVIINGKRSKVYLHREIAGAGPGDYVDHINGDTLDNRRANLRVCDQSTNMHNAVTGKTNITGFKGVRKVGRRYEAQIVVDGKQIRLGRFDSAPAASEAVQAAKQEILS